MRIGPRAVSRWGTDSQSGELEISAIGDAPIIPVHVQVFMNTDRW